MSILPRDRGLGARLSEPSGNTGGVAHDDSKKMTSSYGN